MVCELLGWLKSSFGFFCNIGKTRTKFLANPIYFNNSVIKKKKKRDT